MSKIATGKIFGIGLAKTGTVSLKDALHNLGYNTIHQPKGGLPGTIKTINSCDAVVGIPVQYHYKELDKSFPNSKFILTTRPIRYWLRSYETWTLSLQKIPWGWLSILYDCMLFDRKKFWSGFIKHHKEVKEYFKDRPDDLLIMDFSKGDGWEKLCKFLNKPILNKVFPHLNKNKPDFKKKYNLLREIDKWGEKMKTEIIPIEEEEEILFGFMMI